MKFSEISSFIRDGNYEVNISLAYLQESIERYKEEYGLQLNPDFQRGHVWTEKQQISYVEYFLRGGKSGVVIYFNSPNWSGNDEDIDNMGMVCVDGLQRLTALLKFLNNELKVFGHYINEYEDRIQRCRANSNLRININSLETKKEVLKWYLQMNSGGAPHTEEELDKVKNMLEKGNGKKKID